jgi:hypothetical protein
VHVPEGFEEHFATLRGYVDQAVALLRGRPLQTDQPVPSVRLYLLEGSIVDPAGREVDALARTEGDTLAVYAADAFGALHVLTDALFAVRDGFTGEQRRVIAELVERAAGPPEAEHSMYRTRSWLSIRMIDVLRKRGWDEAWRLIDDHPAERDRVVALFANRPGWAQLVAHYLDQRGRAALTWAPNPEVAEDALRPVLKRAEAELETIMNEMRLSRRDRRKAHREVKGTLDIYWGGSPSHRDMHRHVPGVAKQLAVAAYRAGQPLPVPELIELATRLKYWGSATKPYPYGWRPSRKPPADVGDPVRAAVTAAFAQLLSEPLRSALELDRHHLHEILGN